MAKHNPMNPLLAPSSEQLVCVIAGRNRSKWLLFGLAAIPIPAPCNYFTPDYFRLHRDINGCFSLKKCMDWR